MRVYCPVCRSDANVEQTCVAILSGRDTNRATCRACKVSGMVADWQELEDVRSRLAWLEDAVASSGAYDEIYGLLPGDEDGEEAAPLPEEPKP